MITIWTEADAKGPLDLVGREPIVDPYMLLVVVIKVMIVISLMANRVIGEASMVA